MEYLEGFMKERADKVLAQKGLVKSRSQVKNLINFGEILINGKPLKKVSELIDETDFIEIKSHQYVGRGALKLERALDEFPIEIKGKIFADVGASTGGFTEVLLSRGAKKVYAIDVGHDQLVESLKKDSRVINMEGTNIKEVQTLPDNLDGAVVDLSFISVTKVIQRLSHLFQSEGDLVILIKPQFEAGPSRIPKDGVVKSSSLQQEIVSEVITFIKQMGWNHQATIPSPIEGKSGNKEFLTWFQKS